MFQVQVPVQNQGIPKIQVQNDQYRPPPQVYQPPPTQYAPPAPVYAPPPQPYAPPVQQYAAPATGYPPPPVQYSYSQPLPQQSFYQPPPARQESVPDDDDLELEEDVPLKQNFSVKTVINDISVPSRAGGLLSSSLKRRIPSAEPLRLSSGRGPAKASSYVPIIDTIGQAEPAKKKFTGNKIMGPDDSKAQTKAPIKRKTTPEQVRFSSHAHCHIYI